MRLKDDLTTDEHGLLKDGHRIRVGMMMRDAGYGWRAKMHKHFQAQDGGGELVINTSAPPMVVDAFGGTEGLNRPGARYLATGSRGAGHAVQVTLAHLRDEAYAEYDRHDSEAWRQPARDAVCVPMNNNNKTDSMADVYAAYDAEMSQQYLKAR